MYVYSLQRLAYVQFLYVFVIEITDADVFGEIKCANKPTLNLM